MGAAHIHMAITYGLARSLLHTQMHRRLPHPPSPPFPPPWTLFYAMGWVCWEGATNGSYSCSHGHQLWLLHTRSCTLILHAHPPTPVTQCI